MDEQVNVERLRELLAKATPTPWTVHPRTNATNGVAWVTDEGENVAERCHTETYEADAQLIVAAVNSFPALLDALALAAPLLEAGFAYREARRSYAQLTGNGPHPSILAGAVDRAENVLLAAALALPAPKADVSGGGV